MRPIRLFLASVVGLAGCANDQDLIGDEASPVQRNPIAFKTPINTDKIVQITVPKVDVLWTIDNSCSMQDEQDELVRTFPIFMDFFLGSGLDYHVGVISTDDRDASHSGRLREAAGVRYIDSETPNPSNVFMNMAAMGTDGTGDETGRATIFRAIEQHDEGYNRGFIREDASLHLIVISDEDDSSGTDPISKDEFIAYLRHLKDSEGMVSFSSIVNPPSCGFLCYEGESAGFEYIDVTRAVGGLLREIHNEDWAQLLEDLGMQASGLKREFFLSQLPVDGTIAVRVHDQGNVYVFDEGDDWVYDAARNSILFTVYVPEALSEIQITYDVLAAFQEI